MVASVQTRQLTVIQKPIREADLISVSINRSIFVQGLVQKKLLLLVTRKLMLEVGLTLARHSRLTYAQVQSTQIRLSIALIELIREAVMISVQRNQLTSVA